MSCFLIFVNCYLNLALYNFTFPFSHQDDSLMKHLFVALVSLLLFPTMVLANAPVFPPNPQVQSQARPAQAPMQMQNSAAVNQAGQTQKPFREFSGYLGVVVDVLSPSVKAQLPDGLTQGVMVKELSPDSPATNALQAFDVMVSYDGTALHHPAQFIKLVREDEPTKKVIIKVVRQGQIIDVPVTLGSQKTPNPKEFNGLAIKQNGKDKYRAILRFIGPNGNKQVRTYEGNREEIFQQALNATDLPQAERQQLLYATRPRQKQNNSGFGSFFPFGGNNESTEWMNPRKYFKWFP